MNLSRKNFNYTEFFERLFAVADYYNLKRSQLLDILDITASYMSMMRSGKVGGSFKMLINIIEYFTKINIYWLLFGEGEMLLPENTRVREAEADYSWSKEILNTLSKLTPERRNTVIALINNMIKLTENK